MPRIRSIHPDALKSEKLAYSSPEAERCYWRLQTHCDDEGRAEDDPRLFRSFLFPLHDITSENVDAWLAELEASGLVIRYATEDGRFLAVTRWEDYQHPQRKTPSKLPPPPCIVREGSASTPRDVPPGEGEGEGEGDSSDASVASQAVIFSALVEVFGEVTTRSASGFYGKIAKELREAGATPEQGVARGRRMVDTKGWNDPTPGALAKHWDRLGDESIPEWFAQ